MMRRDFVLLHRTLGVRHQMFDGATRLRLAPQNTGCQTPDVRRLLGVYEDIRYEVDDPVAVITLNRPQALNAWTERMEFEVRDALTRAAGDPKVVGIIVTGEGRAFCAGADMNLLSDISGG